MLDDLQNFISALKSNLILRFGAHKFRNPNFEGLDYIPKCIMKIGNLKVTSTETYESLHKLITKYELNCKQDNRSKNT